MPIYDETTELVLHIVVNNPGIHFRAIIEKAEKQVGVVDYHLNKLENDEMIISVRHRGHKLFFDSHWYDRIDKFKHLVDSLRKSIPRKLLLFLSSSEKNQELSSKEIASALGKSPSSLHWHIKRLIEDQLIRAVRRGRKVTLTLEIDPGIIMTLGNEIYPNRWERFLDDLDSRLER